MAGSMVLLRGGQSLEANITVSDVEITRLSWEHGCTALGVRITFDGYFMQELAETWSNCVAMYLCITT